MAWECLDNTPSWTGSRLIGICTTHGGSIPNQEQTITEKEVNCGYLGVPIAGSYHLIPFLKPSTHDAFPEPNS